MSRSQRTRSRKQSPTRQASRCRGGECWHTAWVLALLVGLLVVLNVYYDDHAMDISLVPRLRGLYATLAAAVLLLLLPASACRVNPAVLRDPLIWCYALFTAVCWLMLAAALNPTAGFTDTFKTTGAFVLLLLLCLLLPSIPSWKERLLQIIACAAILSAVWGAYEIVSLYGFGLHSRTQMTSVHATMANVNLYAGFLILIVPFCFCGLVVLRGWGRVAAGAGAFLSIGMLILLQTRAAYVGLAGSLAVGVALALVFAPALGIGYRARRGLLALAVLVPVSIVIFLLFAPESNPLALRLRTIGAPADDAAAGGRLAMWRITLQMIADHFPLGVGTGNFTVRLDEYFNAETDFSRLGNTNWIYPHNDYLWVLAELGLVGILAFGGIFAVAGWYCLRVLRYASSPTSAWLAVAVVMLLVAYLLNSVFDFPLARINHQLYLAVALAVAVLLRREVATGHDAVNCPSTYPRGLLLAALPVLAVLALGFSYSRAAIKQEFYLAVANGLRDEGLWPAALRVSRAAATPWKTLDPFATPVAYYEAMALAKMGREAETLEALERAYAHNPNRIHVINDLGSYYAKTGRFEEALNLLSETVRRYPHQLGSVENLALCHMDRDDYTAALEVLEAVPEERRTDLMRERIAMCLAALEDAPAARLPSRRSD